MQRFKSLSNTFPGARKAGQGMIEFVLIFGSFSLAAYVFLFALAPKLIAAIH